MILGIMKPFLSFAEESEKFMVWPDGTPETPKSELYTKVTPEQQTMFKLYYALAAANLWKKKAPNVHLFPGML